MKTKEVFISYKSEEFDDALWVKNTLENSGISCWMAPMCITGGASYASEIPAAINGCKAFVLILSNNAQKSKWVPRELDQAINANKVILPFMLEECELNDEFSFYLSNVQRYPAYIDRGESVQKMIREIRELIAKANAEEAIRAEQERIRQEKIAKEKAEQAKNEEVPEAEPINETKPTPKSVPEYKKSTEKKPATPKNKKKMSDIKVIAVVALAFVLLVGCIIAYNVSQTITVAGEKFKKSDYSITLTEKEITQEDVKKISKFKDLGAIRISNSTFKTNDLTEMGQHELYCLELVNCKLTDAQLKSIDFKNLTKLAAINLSGNPNLTDVSAVIHSSERLTELDVSNTGINNIEFVSAFEKLESLSVSGLQLTSLAPLKRLVYLEKLYADNNMLNSLDGLENMTVLEEVSLADNQITDVSYLANSAETLRIVILDNNKLNDVSQLSVCKKLTKFNANNNLLSSLAFLSECTSLSSVSVSGNNLSTLEGIKGVLRHIDVSQNKLTSIEGLLFDNTYSIYADFSDNDITSLLLPKECNYSTLNLKGNDFSDNTFYDGLKGYTIELDYFEALSSELLKELDFGTIKLYGCPDNRKVEFEKASYSIKLS